MTKHMKFSTRAVAWKNYIEILQLVGKHLWLHRNYSIIVSTNKEFMRKTFVVAA